MLLVKLLNGCGFWFSISHSNVFSVASRYVGYRIMISVGSPLWFVGLKIGSSVGTAFRFKSSKSSLQFYWSAKYFHFFIQRLLYILGVGTKLRFLFQSKNVFLVNVFYLNQQLFILSQIGIQAHFQLLSKVF